MNFAFARSTLAEIWSVDSHVIVAEYIDPELHVSEASNLKIKRPNLHTYTLANISPRSLSAIIQVVTPSPEVLTPFLCQKDFLLL